MLQLEIRVAPVACSFSWSHFLVGKQWQRLSYLRTGSLHTHFLSTIWYHTSGWRLRGRSCQGGKIACCKLLFKGSMEKLPPCLHLPVGISLKWLLMVKQNQERDTDLKLLLPCRSCCSRGGNLNFGCWHTVLESDRRDCVHWANQFLLKAGSGFHVYFQIKLETLLLRPPSADSDGLHNLINRRHSWSCANNRVTTSAQIIKTCTEPCI